MGESFQHFDTVSIFGYDMRDGRTAAARFARDVRRKSPAMRAVSWQRIGRPVELAFARDGSLLVADDANGVIDRVAHDREGAGALAPGPPVGGFAKP